MKIRFLTPILLITSSATVLCCQGKKQNQPTKKVQQPGTTVISGSIRSYKSAYLYQGDILAANFGTEQLNPLNTEGRGYVVYHRDNRTEIPVPADGNLSGPKRMFVRDEHLLTRDVDRIVVYDPQAPEKVPQVILLPEGNLFMSDLVTEGDTLYASVTNTGKIFSIDISGPGIVGVPTKWVSIAGFNGLIIENGIMYVASYPVDGKTADNNIIYQITDLSKPVPEKLITTPGQYDSIALSADKKTTHITNWTPAQVYVVDMNIRKVTPLSISPEKSLSDPVDITVTSGTVYIPDLPNGRVIIYPV